MGLLEDTFKFSTGGNYYGTGGSYYDDQEKKKRDFYSKYYSKYKDKRQDTQSITSKKSLEQIAKESQYGKPTDVLPPGKNTQNQNLMKNDFNTKGGINQKNTDPRWWEKLGAMAGVDMPKAQATWNKKGGFEGLMANPAFTMGLAFMQAGAEGKTLGQGALDNVMKAAGISSHYKKIIEDRKQEPIQATTADIGEVKDLLQTMKVDEPNMWEKALGWIKGDNVTAKYDEAAEAIAVEYQKEIALLEKANKSGKPLVIDIPLKKRIIKKVLNSGKIKHKKGWFGPFTKGTIQGTSKDPFKAQGGPVAKGQPYVVGEGGPEYFLPKQSGKILSNDDSRIFAMLLTANPQLQQVSRTRAEKILRNRFPEYFE